jgi:hypothetical protein
MKRNDSYYHHYYARPALLKELILGTFLGLSYVFRIPVEVLTRRNFGERYFNIVLSVTIGIVLLAIPYYGAGRWTGYRWGTMLGTFGTWYAYTVYYLYCVYLRYREILTLPSVWDFKRFSLSEGRSMDFFIKAGTKNHEVNPKYISTVLEPGLFFIGGVILAFMKQPIGYLFILCGLIYSISYIASYYITDQFMMKKIDQMLCNQELHRIFVLGKDPQHGFEFHGKRPKDKESAKRLFEDYMSDVPVEDIDYEEIN